MWCSEGRAVILSVALAAVSGCGFSPAYGPGGVAEDLRGRVEIAAPSDEEGFALVRRLEERLGQATSPDLFLTADIFIAEEAVGFLPDGAISRYEVVGRVDWRVTGDGVAVASGSERAFTGYSATSTTVATIIARRDARRRLMVMIADRIAADIASLDIP